MRKRLLLAALAACGLSAAHAQSPLVTTYFSEDFNAAGTSLPAGWSTSVLTDPTTGWNVGMPSSFSSQSFTLTGNNGIAAINDDKAGASAAAINVWLRMPTVDLTNATNPYLVYDAQFYKGTYQSKTESADIQVSTDGGATWTTLGAVKPLNGFVPRFHDLSAYAGDSLDIRFRYDDGTGWLFGIGIDNVMVGELADYNMAGLDISGERYYGTGLPGNVSVAFQNLSGMSVTSYKIHYSINGITQTPIAVTPTTALAAGDYDVRNFSITPAAGANTVVVWASDFNGTNADAVTGNDTLSFTANAGPSTARVGLWEHFTQASCGPCAFYNPQLQPIADGTANLVQVKYQTSWPGVDPMNAQNPTDVAARVTYYGVSGVPHAVLNGGLTWNDNPSAQLVNGTYFADAAVQATPMTLSIDTARQYGNSMDLVCTVGLIADRSLLGTGSFRLRAALVEETITFSSAPGSNGETEFHNVMKKMLPNPTGTPITITTNGQTQKIKLTTAVDPAKIYDMGQLRFVAWIQNDGDKAVWNAANSGALKLGVREAQLLQAEVRTYPNPANASAFMSFEQQGQRLTLRLTDAAGRQVYTQAVQPFNGTVVLEVPTASLPNGVYAATLTTANGELVTSSRVAVAH